jgi:hypothetical protein
MVGRSTDWASVLLMTTRVRYQDFSSSRPIAHKGMLTGSHFKTMMAGDLIGSRLERV